MSAGCDHVAAVPGERCPSCAVSVVVVADGRRHRLVAADLLADVDAVVLTDDRVAVARYATLARHVHYVSPGEYDRLEARP